MTAQRSTEPAERASPPRWDGVMRPREWALLVVSLGVLVAVVPLRMVAVMLAVVGVAIVIRGTPWRRNVKMVLALGLVAVFVVIRQIAQPPTVAHVLWSGAGIYAFFVLRIVDLAVSRDDGVPAASTGDVLGRHLLYVTCFPLLFAGPVLTERDLWRSYAPGRLDVAELPRHAVRFAWGAVKFFVLFEAISNLQGDLQRAAVTGSSAGLAVELPTVVAAWAAVSLTLVFVYVGFSGFSDMGTAVARVLGFDVYDNFRLPLLSRSPLDFWKRSNISTYRWLMTHVFLPYWRHDRVPAKIVTTFFASALWHVAAIRTISAGAVLQLSLGSGLNALGVMATWRTGRSSAGGDGSIAGAARTVRDVLAVVGTFLFTALVFQLFWAGIVNAPVSTTRALFEALVPGGVG